ncbi:MAG: DegV family protein [Clostridia bacterium]|nr:DegV family protein [Clostridia bacterium]
MNRFRIVADSACDLLALDGADFVGIPLTIRTDTVEFRDDASLDVDAMVQTLLNTKSRSYSACPGVADWEDAFGESGDVIAFTITSGLSGSYNSAQSARNNCLEHDPSRRIHVVDSLSAGPEIALLIEKARACANAGMDADEAFRAVEAYKERTHLLFSLESMHNLAQNGRVSKLVATMAGVLGIRAIGQASAEGKLEMLGKCRGAAKARAFLLNEMERFGYKGGSVRIGHCQNETAATELSAAIRDRFPGADVKFYPSRGLCSYYAERGGIMMGFES